MRQNALDTTNETTEMWRALRRDRQARRSKHRAVRTDAINLLRKLGFQVREVTEFQFRINNALDLYPTSRRYHHLPSNRRGHYSDPAEIARRLLSDTKGSPHE